MAMWLSADLALTDYVSKDYDGASGGIYNTINLNVYHYGGNNPIRYVDPMGRENKKWLDWIQGGLDVVGFIRVGEIADGINGLISLGSWRLCRCWISLASMIPLVGDVGKGAVKRQDRLPNMVMRSLILQSKLLRMVMR